MTETKKTLHHFLKYFPGHGASSPSYGRFAYEDMDRVLELVKKNDRYYSTTRIGRMELDGKRCISLYGKWIQIRRRNGEPFWNICKVRSHALPDFTDDDILKFVQFLRDNGVTVHLAEMDNQYITPLSEEKLGHIEEDTRGWCTTDSMSILAAQKMEQKWKREIIMSVETLETEIQGQKDNISEIQKEIDDMEKKKQQGLDEIEKQDESFEKQLEEFIAKKYGSSKPDDGKFYRILRPTDLSDELQVQMAALNKARSDNDIKNSELRVEQHEKLEEIEKLQKKVDQIEKRLESAKRFRDAYQKK